MHVKLVLGFSMELAGGREPRTGQFLVSAVTFINCTTGGSAKRQKTKRMASTNGASGGSTQDESIGNKRTISKMMGYLNDDRPNRLKANNQVPETLKKEVSKIIDKDIFPYQKFFRKQSDIGDTDHIMMIYMKMNWIGKKVEDQLRRCKNWIAVEEITQLRMGEKRTYAITSIARYCASKYCAELLLFVPDLLHQRLTMRLVRLLQKKQEQGSSINR